MKTSNIEFSKVGLSRIRDHACVLSVQEAAELCNVSMSFLNKARISGAGPRYLKFSPSPKGRVAYQLADLQEWMESKKRNNTSEQG